MSREFNARVQRSFPLGSSTQRMAAELEAQGFQQQDWIYGSAGHVAVRREDNWVCNQAARLFWSEDKDGKLTSIRGDYREEGCL